VSNILAGSACRICQCLWGYQRGSSEPIQCLQTLFTTIPPSEWHMNIRGLLEASNSCKGYNSAYLEHRRGLPTARSASNCATRVCACWRIRSEDVLPMNEVAFALYPNVKIREFLTTLGRSSGLLSQQVPDLVVQVL